MAAETCRDKENPGRQEKFVDDKDVLGALPDGRYRVKGTEKELSEVGRGNPGKNGAGGTNRFA